MLERDAVSDGARTNDDADVARDAVLEIDFDFVSHELILETSDGGREVIALKPMTVAAFYER